MSILGLLVYHLGYSQKFLPKAEEPKIVSMIPAETMMREITTTHEDYEVMTFRDEKESVVCYIVRRPGQIALGISCLPIYVRYGEN